MQLLHRPWIRSLLLSVLTFSAAVLYCQTHFYRDPGSRFYDRTRAYERSYSLFREQEVEQYIKAASNGAVGLKVGDRPKICATFVSVKREGDQYLPLALASSLAGLSPKERSDLHVNVLFAHVDYATHPSSSLRWLHNVADHVSNYNATAKQLSVLSELEKTQNFAEKAVFDYTHALQACYDTGAPFIALFEDDIILAESWFIQTWRAVYALGLKKEQMDTDWLFMRLFNQERSTGWASREIGGNNEPLISSIVAAFTAAFLILMRRTSKLVRRNLDVISVAIICLCTVPAFVVLFFQAGKASLLPPRPGVRQEPFGCCSQGLVFPRHQILRINEYLLGRGKGQIDMMLDELSISDNLARYALYPVQLQHIGTRSARKTLEQEAQAIWSMAFEQQNPLFVAQKHRVLVKAMYSALNT